ncbi:MAG: hypothetical protein JST01_11880 [Cyanobacteria bacterium SZAS TMP-1]|nr:hypothetical protein [Cyanobacteria bacterium SZAS TMP-1]
MKRTTRHNHGLLLIAACVVGLGWLGAAETARAFTSRDSDGQSLHGKIVREALSSTLNSTNLDLIIKSLEAQARDKAEGESKLFGGPSLKNVVLFVDREQKKVLNYAADADVSPASRYHCLKHFGELLFAVQDFYSRSNYVEVESEKMAGKFGKGAFDPYSIDLVDWNKLNVAQKQNGFIPYGPASQPKESADQGKVALANSTYFKTARELAVRDTSRQWEIIETLIKNRYHDRSVTILAALKQASVPAAEPDSLD